MSKFFDDTLQGLTEAIAIKKGELSVVRRHDMPGEAYYVAQNGTELVDKVVQIRKNEKISQTELASRTGNTQQAISRFETHTNSASVTLFASIVDALGYEVQLVKKA